MKSPLAVKILIVEDDRTIQAILAEMLEPLCGSAIRFANSYPDAVRALEVETPDVVLADCHLGSEGSGIDLYRLCLQKTPGVPFVLVSGMPDFVFNELLATGTPCPAFLPKPFNTAQCHAIVRKMFAASYGAPASAA